MNQNGLTLCILETPKGVLWQAVQTQIKCTIMVHLSGSALFAKIKTIFRDINTSFRKFYRRPLKYTQWAVPKLLYQSVWENPSEYNTTG